MHALLIGLTIGTVGKLILGFSVWRVHAHILEEHKIDRAVLDSIRKERYVTLIGLLLIFTGYVLEMYFYGHGISFIIGYD